MLCMEWLACRGCRREEEAGHRTVVPCVPWAPPRLTPVGGGAGSAGWSGPEGVTLPSCSPHHPAVLSLGILQEPKLRAELRISLGCLLLPTEH